MRLTDADKYLEKVCTYKETGCGSCKLQTMCPKDAPTVEAIPVEVYEQVKWERDTAIGQLKALNIELGEKPHLEAIPIEWIKQWDTKCQNGELNYWLYDYYEWHEAIVAMLEDWREENESSKVD